MPVFNAHIPRGRFSPEQKRALADALDQSLTQGLGIPEGDRFIMLSEHGPDEMFLYPTLRDLKHDFTSAVIIAVPVGTYRPLEDRRILVEAITRLVVSAVGISSDDVFITLVPVSAERNFIAPRIWPWD